MELLVKTTAKLYECRDTAKRFFGSEFNDAVKPYKNVLLDHKKASGKETLECLIDCLKSDSIQGNGMAVLMFNAAAVELIENLLQP